jgi:hypothetical protein
LAIEALGKGVEDQIRAEGHEGERGEKEETKRVLECEISKRRSGGWRISNEKSVRNDLSEKRKRHRTVPKPSSSVDVRDYGHGTRLRTRESGTTKKKPTSLVLLKPLLSVKTR